ncbi:MAG TPA: cobalamin-dependent protein [Solirubrobacterales bacterium]|jgi:methylmalonyl-CoA mutase cobalamin-binding domain/chain|nr:cobalamin-dependent protein [Solirubrobacterales bacterium]
MSEIDVDLSALLPADLPDGREAVAEGRALAGGVERERSLFCEAKGVGSEREWRERARAERFTCTCMNIGLATWADTREALGLIYENALSRGVRPPDRFNLIAERRMGLPKEKRAEAPQETGPALWSDQDWWDLAHTVPIQPEAADNMIGGPGSVDNALDALRVGITHIGVLSQYSWRWPYWDDEVSQTMAVLRAAGLLSAFKADGVCFDSYLEDGYPGVFHDYANYVGWSMLERYVSEELIGAAYSCSWGGLTQDPVVKSAVTLALHAVNPDEVPAGFVQGDTIGNTPDFDSNMAVVSSDVLFMKMVDRRYRLGGAPIAVPVTETERIPSWEEVATVQTISRRLEEYVPLVDPVVDWVRIEAIRDKLVAGGRAFFAAAINGLSGAGVDVRDPAQLLLVLKRLGSSRCEELFGAGAPDDAFPRGRRPVLETDLVKHTMAERERLLEALRGGGEREAIRGMKVLVTSTDVHEFAEFLLASALAAVGAEVIDFGINRDPEDIVKAVIETDADAVVVTTHNGVARSFGQRLISELGQAQARDVPVFMGGVLNEDVDGSEIPIDVRADLNTTGIETPGTIDRLIDALVARRGGGVPA